MVRETLRVMIVEDDPDQSALLETIIETLGHEIRAHDTLAAARKTVVDWIPDLVLLDLGLPDGDGLDLLRFIKDDPGFHDILVVVISAASERSTIIKALTLGANEFFPKPYDLGEISVKLRNLFELKLVSARNYDLAEELTIEKNRIQKQRDLISRYFSRDLVDAILAGSINVEVGGDVQTVSILFIDLRGSTGLAESISPKEFSEFLSYTFTDITDLILGRGGSVNKFLGDGILATFGCPRPLENDAKAALDAAVQIRKYVKSFNELRPAYLKEPVAFGIGVARGEVFVGNIGSKSRMEYTVLGDAVNVAARLQYLTKKAGVDILIDGKVYHAAKDLAKVIPVQLRSIRGKKKEVEIFALKEFEAGVASS